jgi:hypothetical protein
MMLLSETVILYPVGLIIDSVASTVLVSFSKHVALKPILILGLKVLTAVSTKMAVFWVAAPCSLVEVYQRSRGPCCLQHHHPDDGGSKDLWNVGKLLPDYKALQPRRQPSSILILSS